MLADLMRSIFIRFNKNLILRIKYVFNPEKIQTRKNEIENDILTIVEKHKLFDVQ